MEFIPLENDSEKTKGKRKIVTAKSLKKLKVDETNKEVNFHKTKEKSKFRVLEKKNVKNKYKETLALKWKDKALKKKIRKAKKDEEEEEVVTDNEEETESNEAEEVKDESEEAEDDDDDNNDDDDDDDDDGEDEEEQEKNKEEEAFKRKCKEMDEKKKTRLFIKLKKKIHNEAMIKELHPNIRGVIFPRKKNPRWCWAVFASEAKANEALKQLHKNTEILASKPNPYEKVDQKQKKKMKTVLRKKETKKKLLNIWV